MKTKLLSFILVIFLTNLCYAQLPSICTNCASASENANLFFNQAIQQNGKDPCTYNINDSFIHFDCPDVFTLTINGQTITVDPDNPSMYPPITFPNDGSYPATVQISRDGQGDCGTFNFTFDVTGCIPPPLTCNQLTQNMIASITPTGTCGEYTMQIPDAALNDYTIWFKQQSYTSNTIITATDVINNTYTFNYEENGEHIVSVSLTTNNTKCGDKTIVLVDCIDDCEECNSVIDNITATLVPTGNCGEFSIAIPEDIFNCYKIGFSRNETSSSNDHSSITPAQLMGGNYFFDYSSSGIYYPKISLSSLSTGQLLCVRFMTAPVTCFFTNSTTNIKRTAINVYPNPAESNGELQFSGIDLKDISSIEILDLKGISRLKSQPRTNSFRVNNLNTGIYIIKFSTKSGEIIQKRLIIK